jgi:glycosyltransferase involved in cell wall biosynthesis
MRILQIIPTLGYTGAAKQMSLLSRGLSREKYDLHVCALSHGGPLLADLERAGISVAAIGRRWRVDPRAFWRLKRHVSQLRPDVVHTWLFDGNAYGCAAARACGVKCVVATQRCADPWKGAIESAVDRCVARHSSHVVVNSPSVRDHCVRRGLPAEKIRVIPNGVAPARPGRLTRHQWLAELGLAEQCRLVGLVGPLVEQKRIKDAIWAADLLKVVRDDVHLLIVGDGPHRDRLMKFRDQVLIRDKVHFLGERADVLQLMPHLDVLWSTSAYEGQCNAILEAMAAGVPVVATDIPGTRDLVENATTGYLVPVGNRAGITRCTQKLLNDGALAERLGRAGRGRAEAEFSVQRMIDRYVNLYR